MAKPVGDASVWYMYFVVWKRNDMSTTFLQQILSSKLLLIVTVRVKK